MHVLRELDKRERDKLEKEKEEKRRKERKNRDAFKVLLQQHLKEGSLHAKLRWKVQMPRPFLRFRLY